ncbi:MAG: hypothetical protein ACOYBX_02405 [Mycobacterium sp.]|jgi:hypothetical protein
MTTIDTRRIGLLLGGIAVAATAALSGCSSSTEKPSKSTEAPSPSAPQSASPAPTEKAPNLTPGGANSFSPTIKAPAAPTALPGNVITGN